jgi:hypothetical protein
MHGAETGNFIKNCCIWEYGGVYSHIIDGFNVCMFFDEAIHCRAKTFGGRLGQRSDAILTTVCDM